MNWNDWRLDFFSFFSLFWLFFCDFFLVFFDIFWRFSTLAKQQSSHAHSLLCLNLFTILFSCLFFIHSHKFRSTLSLEAWFCVLCYVVSWFFWFQFATCLRRKKSGKIKIILACKMVPYWCIVIGFFFDFNYHFKFLFVIIMMIC